MKNKLTAIGLTLALLSGLSLPAKAQSPSESKLFVAYKLANSRALGIVSTYNNNKIDTLLQRSCVYIQQNYSLIASKAVLSRYFTVHKKMELGLAIDMADAFITTAHYMGCNSSV